MEIEGRVASLLEVGTGFHPELSGRENIFLNGAILGMTKSEIREKFDAIVEFAEVSKFIDTPVKRYSSGMYVRLAFAVAAHLEPEILVVDEVLAVGDTAFQAKCLGKMQDISSSGRTTLFVSHNLAAVQSLCDKVLVLSDSRVQFIGDCREGVSHYMASTSQDNTNVYETPNDSKLESYVRRIEVVLPHEGTQPDQPSNGMSFIVDLKADDLDGQFSLLLGVYDELGTKLLFLNSSTVGTNIMRGKTQTAIISLSPHFCLAEGAYGLNAALCLDGKVIHHIQNKFRFHIRGFDFYGTGKSPATPVHVSQTWQISID